MQKNSKLKIICLACLALFIGASIVITPASALLSQNNVSWYWTSDTSAASMATGDVNGDGQLDIVIVGYYNDGTHWIGQLHVLNANTMAVEAVRTWSWGTNTQAVCVAVGKISGGTGLEIVTGGSYFDGTRWVAQLIVFNGVTLAVENTQTWYWGSNTRITSVAIGDVNGDGVLEIVTGGSYWDGTRYVALLHVWNAITLSVEAFQSWFWTSNTYINSIALGNITGGTGLEIVTGGAYFDGTRYIAQLHVWNGQTLAAEKVMVWYWGSNTEINAVSIASLNGGTTQSIVTGGTFNDGTRDNAQVIVWNTATPVLSVQNIVTWAWPSGTKVSSVAIGNYTGGANLDIVTGGSYQDGTRWTAQLLDFDSSNLAVKSSSNWFINSNTAVNSVAIANVAGTGNRVISCGSFYDLTRSNAQVIVWT